MLAEFLDRLHQLAQEDALRRPLHVPGDAAHLARFMTPAGQVVTLEKAPQVLDARAHSLEGMVGLINTLYPKGEEPGATQRPAVWASGAGVVAVLDEARRNRVSLALAKSRPFARLLALARERPALNQKALLSLLRLDLFKHLTADSLALLAAARKVTFRKTSEGESELARDRSSVGKRIEAQVAGAGQFPELVTFLVPLWAGLGKLVMVEAAVVIDFEDAAFQVVPFEESLESAQRVGEEWLCQRLREGISNTAIPIFHGTP